MHRSTSKTRPAMRLAPPALPALSSRTGVPAVSAAAPPTRTRHARLAAGSRDQQQSRSMCSSDSQPAMSLAVAALLGSVGACVAMPLCRRLGSMLDPARCPDNCWQAVAVSALVVGPVVGCLAFVAVAVLLRCCSVTAFASLSCAAVIAAMGAVISGAANAADAFRPQSVQGACCIRCPPPFAYPADASCCAVSCKAVSPTHQRMGFLCRSAQHPCRAAMG